MPGSQAAKQLVSGRAMPPATSHQPPAASQPPSFFGTSPPWRLPTSSQGRPTQRDSPHVRQQHTKYSYVHIHRWPPWTQLNVSRGNAQATVHWCRRPPVGSWPTRVCIVLDAATVRAVVLVDLAIIECSIVIVDGDWGAIKPPFYAGWMRAKPGPLVFFCERCCRRAPI